MTKAVVDRTATREKGSSGKVRPRSVCVAAPSGVDTVPIRKSLEAKGVRPFSPDELDLPGLRLDQILREALQRADIVVAVVDATPASSFVFYEVGFAQGMNKPVIVLLMADASSSFWGSTGVPYFRFNPDNPAGLEFAINQILAIPYQEVKTSPAPTRRTQPLGGRVDDLLTRLREQGVTLTDEDFQTIISQAIQASGVTTLAQGNGEQKNVDLAVWSDDLSPWIGYPLAVALQRSLQGATAVAAAIAQLTQGMARGNMLWGLLIYLQSPLDVGSAVTAPNVLAVSAERFLEALRTLSFGDLVRQLRKQRVHGGP